MTRRVRTALVSVVCFVGGFAVVLLVGNLLRSDDGPETDTLTIPEALRQPAESRVAVHGYVFFDEETGPLFCSMRTSDDPPACGGSVMRLENLDPNRLDLLRSDETEGAYDAYSRDVVALLGVKLGAVLVVEDVLR